MSGQLSTGSAIRSRRVLIISTTFFPDPAVSAIRMTQWCRHLPEYGWQPYVLCRYYGFEATPEDLARHVHPDVSIEYLDRSSDAAPGDVASPLQRLVRRILNSWLLNGVWVPDLSIRFWRKHRQQILERVQAIQPDVIITTSPPHSNHDIGLWLARETGIPWIADFRDPYLIDIRFKPSGLGRLRWLEHERFRESIYRRAWLITHAIPMQARWARRFYPFARDRIRILTNGFPKELLTYLAKEPAESAQSRSIRVAGTILPQEQLLLAEAVAEVAQDGHDVDLTLIGKPPDNTAPFEELLGEQFIATDYVSHDEAIQLVAGAAVLVNFLDAFRSASRLLSTKLFEYLATNRPILAINPSHSERLLLRRFSHVRVLRQPGVSQLADALRSALTKPVSRDPDKLDRFRSEWNWTNHVGHVAKWLDHLTSFPPKQVVLRNELPVASVVIPTLNRKHLLERVIRSALAQTIPVEVIVLDDGSSDDTVEMLRQIFPQVQLHQFHRRGPSFLRNHGIELASTEFVFAIDDDSIFSSPRVIEQTLSEFDDPRVAAVGIPFLNPRLDWTYRQHAEDAMHSWIGHAFVGAAHAVKRSIFLKAGGYREQFFYMGEEGDLCIRFLDAGFVVRIGRADPIYHVESDRRNFALADFCGRRNDILFAWYNVPMPFLFFHLVGTTFNGAISGVKSQHVWRMLRGTLQGYVDCLRYWDQRKPVSVRTYRLSRLLKKRGPISLAAIRDALPPLCSAEKSEADAARRVSKE